MKQVHLDTRIGWCPRYVFCDESELMQVPFELLKCVCFIEVKAASDWKLGGTAFFLSRRLEGVNRAVEPDSFIVYAVTAKHVLCMDGGAPDDDPWWYDDARLVLNGKSGSILTYPAPPEAWTKHPDSDTAVMTVGLPDDVFDFMHYPSESFVNGPFLMKWELTPGEEVVLPGLLSVHPGRTSMQPIVRTGNIAAWPRDPISMETGDEEGYLIEVRSFGGLSGSPAFLHLTDTRRDDWARGEVGISKGKAGLSGSNFLLGIVNGWFPNHEPASQARHALNTGITAVIPAVRIMDILDSQGYINEREAVVKAKNKTGPQVKPAKDYIEMVCGNYDYDAGGVIRGEDARLIALAPEMARLLIDMADAVDHGYFDRTTDTWRCAMCDAPEGHSDGCSHGELMARFAALDKKAGG